MNDITFIYQNLEEESWNESFKVFINEVLKVLDINGWEFSVTLCDNSYIHTINRDFRHKDKPTDVITFVMSDEPFPCNEEENEVYSAGDIIISLETVKENSEYFKVQYEEELKRVVIHGILHLKGYDHETNEPVESMLVLQEEVLKKLTKQGIF